MNLRHKHVQLTDNCAGVSGACTNTIASHIQQFSLGGCSFYWCCLKEDVSSLYFSCANFFFLGPNQIHSVFHYRKKRCKWFQVYLRNATSSDQIHWIWIWQWWIDDSNGFNDDIIDNMSIKLNNTITIISLYWNLVTKSLAEHTDAFWTTLNIYESHTQFIIHF